MVFIIKTSPIYIWIGIILVNVISKVALEDIVQADDSTGLITSTESPNTTQPNYKDACFYSEPELCTKHKKNDASESVLCRCYPYLNLNDSYYCCNITDISMISSCSPTSSWKKLHVYNATLRILDVSKNFFQTLHSLAITDGNITKISYSMSRAALIKCVNVSNNYLTDINPRAFTSLQNLEVIDISNNNLSRIPNLNTHRSMIVDLSGNKKMLCDSLLTMIQGSFKFVGADRTFCLLNQTFNWFNTTDYVPIGQLERWKQLHSDCPKIKDHGNCTCDAEQMVYETKTNDKPHLIFTAKVDCSNLGLTSLPPKLPENTLSLNISNNNITNFGNHFHTNPSYFHILKLYADNNKISSMYELEGTQFIDVFQEFFLRKNDLEKIPEYLLSNTLENNPNGRAIYLGGNALTCDCNSAKVLRLWLLARQKHIPDYNQILCRNMPQKVVDLQELKLCQSPHDWTDYIFYLIASEVFLLLALITKVSYDYWIFKTAGYLPWPANKMPKLPCDWLCES